MARTPLGKEKDAVSDMKKFWLDASSQPLYQDWWFGPWAALYGASGIYDLTPL
jgi:hypothetical protein